MTKLRLFNVFFKDSMINTFKVNGWVMIKVIRVSLINLVVFPHHFTLVFDLIILLIPLRVYVLVLIRLNLSSNFRLRSNVIDHSAVVVFQLQFLVRLPHFLSL